MAVEGVRCGTLSAPNSLEQGNLQGICPFLGGQIRRVMGEFLQAGRASEETLALDVRAMSREFLGGEQGMNGLRSGDPEATFQGIGASGKKRAMG